MQIADIMTRDVDACRPEDTLDRAVEIMLANDCGCVPVVASDGSGRVEGLVTDRDTAIAAHKRRRPLHDLYVQDAMTAPAVACGLEDPVEEAEQRMRELQIRRLPVVDGRGHLAGMLALADLAREAARARRPGTRAEVSETEVGDVVAAVSQE